MDKRKKLKLRQVGKSIAFIPFDIFFDCFSYIEEDTIWWSFNMKDFVYEWTGGCISS